MKNLHALFSPLFIVLLLSSLLIGCASGPDYRATNGSRYGYQEVKLSDTHYRVQYKLRGAKPDKAMDYALLRAAELTLANEYDWFLATNNELLVDQGREASSTQLTRQYNRSTQCGLLSCSTSYYPTTVATHSINTGSTPSTQVFLTISFGKGTRPDNSDSYDAQDIHDTIIERHQLVNRSAAR